MWSVGHNARKSRKIRNTAIIASYVVLSLIIVALIGVNIVKSQRKSDVVKIETEEEVTKNEGSIDIPCFEAISFKSGELWQDVQLYNPTQNNCYFVITLQLSDGTVLWKSDYIEPGYSVTSIQLEKTLEAGTYTDSLIKYECFRLDSKKTPLNGAEAKITIFVK